MNKDKLVKELFNLLPIDDDSLGQMIENAWKLSSQSAIYEYWTGLLGQSPDALDFITHFTSNASDSKPHKPSLQKKSQNKPESTFSPPTRKDKDPWNTNPQASSSSINRLNKVKNNKNVPKTVSQLLDPPKPETTIQKKPKTQKIDNIQDLEDVLRKLELSSSDENSVCNCMARLHPLFDIAPNCLNCGKIICVKEGLRPCSFCGASVIPDKEKEQIVQLLKSEKQELENRSKKPTQQQQQLQSKSKAKVQRIQYNAGAGNDFWKKTDKLLDDLNKAKEAKQTHDNENKNVKEQEKEIEYYENYKAIDPDLAKVRANLENLLNFQANDAERTKIIDNASDYELPTGSNLNIWSNSVEKALQLKKQQRALRDLEDKEKQRSGRAKRVLDISIGKDGKAIMREVVVKDEPDAKELKQIAELEQNIQKTKDAKNEQDFNTLWDYKKDSEKWEKPKYTGHISEIESHVNLDSLPQSERIQLGNDGDLEEMVTFI